VSFHKLEPNLTRVMVEMEFEPNGLVEKLASGLRFVKREQVKSRLRLRSPSIR
jgi:hypothetical protein